MVARALVSVLVGLVVYLVALLVLALFPVDAHPWAPLLGLLAGAAYFLKGGDVRF